MSEYIEREAATNVACNILWKMNSPSTSVMAKALNSIPAADVAPVRHGQWEDIVESVSILSETGFPITTVAETCNSCRFRSCFVGPKVLLHDYNCPNCGAKMDGGADV